jgi:O-antigen ligase
MVEYSLVITILLLPLQFALNVGENFDLATTRIFVPAVFLLWLVRGMARKKVWIPNKAEIWLAGAFLFLSLFSLFLGRDADAGFRKLTYLFSIFPVLFVAADVFREQKWEKRGAVAIVASGMIAAVVALAQFFLPFAVGIGKAVKIWESLAPYFLGNSLGRLVAANSSWLVNIGGETRMRAFGFFPDPHNFSFFANLCLFFCLGYFFSRKRFSSKIWIGAVSTLLVLAVFLSYSRGAYLGLIAGIVFFVSVTLKRSGILGKALVICGVMAVLLFAFNSNIVSQRLASSFNLREGSNAERYKNWTQAVEIVRDHPLGGVGLGNYARAIDPSAEDRSSIYAHNLFLDIAAETGILNSLAFFLLIIVSVWKNVKNGGALNLGIAAGLIGFSVHSIFDTPLWSPQVMVLFLVVMALGMSNVRTNALSSRT